MFSLISFYFSEAAGLTITAGMVSSLETFGEYAGWNPHWHTIDVLTKSLGDEEWLVRKPAALALAVCGSAAKDAVPKLLEALNDAEWPVLKSAVIALTAIAPEYPDVKAALKKRLGDPEEQIRLAAGKNSSAFILNMKYLEKM